MAKHFLDRIPSNARFQCHATAGHTFDQDAFTYLLPLDECPYTCPPSEGTLHSELAPRLRPVTQIIVIVNRLLNYKH
jgi:hypothetical protein